MKRVLQGVSVCAGIFWVLILTPAWGSEKTLCLGMGFQRTSRLFEVNGANWKRQLLLPWIEGRLQWGPAVRFRFAFVNGGYRGTYNDYGTMRENSREYSGVAWGLEWIIPSGGRLGNLTFAGEVTQGHNSVVSGGGPMFYYWTTQSDLSAGYRRRSRGGAISLKAAILVSYFQMEQGTSILSPYLELSQVAPGVSVEGMALPFRPLFVCGQIGWIAGLNASFSGGIRFK